MGICNDLKLIHGYLYLKLVHGYMYRSKTDPQYRSQDDPWVCVSEVIQMVFV